MGRPRTRRTPHVRVAYVAPSLPLPAPLHRAPVAEAVPPWGRHSFDQCTGSIAPLLLLTSRRTSSRTLVDDPGAAPPAPRAAGRGVARAPHTPAPVPRRLESGTPTLLVERSVLSTPVVVVGDLREGPRNTNTRRIGAHNVGCALGRHRALGTGACVRCDGCCASGGEGQRRGVGGGGAGVITAQLIGEGGEAEHDSPIWPLFHRDALEPPEAAPVDQNKYFHGTPNVPRPAPSW